MAQNQRKQAGWRHEIDGLASGDFKGYVKRSESIIKRLRTNWRRLLIATLISLAANIIWIIRSLS